MDNLEDCGGSFGAYLLVEWGLIGTRTDDKGGRDGGGSGRGGDNDMTS